MHCLLSKVIEIEFALSKIEEGNLYSAGLDLFQVMNFPVKPSTLAVNTDIYKYIYNKLDNRTLFSIEEHYYLKKVSSISTLFTLSAKDLGSKKLYATNKFFEEIIFLAIDLNCYKSDRSRVAYTITKILNKVLSHPMFILFHHDGLIMFSGLIYEDLSNEESGKVYLSDWHCCDDADCEKKFKLYQLFFENHNVSSIENLFIDIIYSIARQYYVYKESYEYLTYGYFIGKASSFLTDGDFLLTNIREIYEENYSYYHRLYGDDYVEEEFIEMLLPEDDDWIFDDLEEFIPEDEDLEGEEFEDRENIYEDEEDENINYYMPKGLNEDYFKDPIKILEWLEKKEEI